MENTKIIFVDAYMLEKVKKTGIKIHIPTEPIFFHQYEHSIITGIFPKFQDDEVVVLDIVRINSDKIISTILWAKPDDLSKQLEKMDDLEQTQTPEDELRYNVLIYLRDFYTQYRATKEEFINIYDELINKIDNIIQSK